ncbi:hypothetical protein [Nonomuraea rubra]|uniref:hypothetical protein n=1 Tax=Nonomuraea rubra TaxID=46180 RepID=UPI00340A0D36
MGELVGIDPRGAHDLIRRMEAVKAFLGRTRPGLDAAIAEAGQDWAGRQGSTALHRVWAFLHESQHDLKWRIDTVEQLVPVRERGLLTATFPFSAESEARHEAEQAAAAIRGALDAPSSSGPAATQVAQAVAATAGKAGDPAYAAALLAALGPDAFVRALHALTTVEEHPTLPPDTPQGAAGTHSTTPDAPHSASATHGAGAAQGTGATHDAGAAHGAGGAGAAAGGAPGASAEGARGAAALLARAFASAERTGRLGDEWQAVAESASPQALTALVSLAGQSGAVLHRVALALLDRPEPGGDLHGLITAYAANPLAFQQFLAEHPREAGTLLATGDPALPAALDEALKPGAGADGLRERAWANVRSLGGG